MNKLLLFRDLYTEAFRNLGHIIVSSYLKVLTWSSVALIGVVAYAFVYRLATGFYF